MIGGVVLAGVVLGSVVAQTGYHAFEKQVSETQGELTADPKDALPDQKTIEANKKKNETARKQEEQHEQEDVRGTDLDGGADDTVGGIDQVIDGALKGLVRTHGQQRVGHKGGRHNDDGDTDDPPAGLHQHQDCNDANDDLGGADAAAHGDQLFFKDDLIEINANCHHKQDNVVNRNMIGLELHILLDGVHDEDKRQYNAQEETAAHAALPGGKHTDPNHHQHE